jgi:hypothetical protein
MANEDEDNILTASQRGETSYMRSETGDFELLEHVDDLEKNSDEVVTTGMHED